jgi:hypothetical protein
MPKPKNHYGTKIGKIRYTFPTGGTGTIQVLCSFCSRGKQPCRFAVTGGFRNLSTAQAAAHDDARLRAHPDNGGDINTAARIMKAAQAEVLWA